MHASTFGGNPLAMAAGLATIETIEEEGLLDNVPRRCPTGSASDFTALQGRTADHRRSPRLRHDDRRRPGDPVDPAVAKCMERGLLINATHDTVLRLLPALNIGAEQVEEGCEVLADVLREMAETA